MGDGNGELTRGNSASWAYAGVSYNSIRVNMKMGEKIRLHVRTCLRHVSHAQHIRCFSSIFPNAAASPSLYVLNISRHAAPKKRAEGTSVHGGVFFRPFSSFDVLNGASTQAGDVEISPSLCHRRGGRAMARPYLLIRRLWRDASPEGWAGI